MSAKEAVLKSLEDLINQTKISLNDVKTVAIAQAWKILQLAVAHTIQIIEAECVGLAGKDKKTIAMEALSKFYDSVFIVIDIPFVPNMFEPIIHGYVKKFLMVLVGSTIDAMVATFKEIGVFQSK
jgi:hypothetical protein